MRKTAIIGVGMTAVAEHWGSSLKELAQEASEKAIENAGYSQIDALYVGNAYASTFNNQSQLGALLADYIGLRGVEAYTIEAGTASGGVALRTAHLAVSSGEVDCALVLGVEKVTDIVASGRVKALNVSLDADTEAIHGATLPAMAALLMRRYMYEYGIGLDAFEGFSINAHSNGKRNALAMYRNTIKAGAFNNAPMIADPVSLFDSAPDGDGAAAVLIIALDQAEDLVAKPIRIGGSGVASDTLALQDRADMLRFMAVEKSVDKALRQANVTLDDIDGVELHDIFTIVSALSLEASGYAKRGEGWRWASNQAMDIGLTGKLPIGTFGGLKSRGNPAGASGIYQAVEATLQLRHEANDNQIDNPHSIMIQNLGGLASTAVTHILQI
jgi:acetyl-CoA C-acetyltransferase